MKRSRWQAPLVMAVTLALVIGLFAVLYFYDNKYTYDQPRGSAGILELAQEDLDRLIFLTTGWVIVGPDGTEEEAFIGQYSNLSFAPGGEARYGQVCYRLRLELAGEPRDLVLQLPETFTRFCLYIDGRPVMATGDGSAVSFRLDGRVELLAEVTSDSYYYSGLYSPPALGTVAQIARLQFMRNLFYGGLMVNALTLLIFSVSIWARGLRGDSLLFHFTLMCLVFFVGCLHSLLWQLGWNGPGDGARLLMWPQTLAAAAIAAGAVGEAVDEPGGLPRPAGHGGALPVRGPLRGDGVPLGGPAAGTLSEGDAAGHLQPGGKSGRGAGRLAAAGEVPLWPVCVRPLLRPSGHR